VGALGVAVGEKFVFGDFFHITFSELGYLQTLVALGMNLPWLSASAIRHSLQGKPDDRLIR
jgi:hypothetical protein